LLSVKKKVPSVIGLPLPATLAEIVTGVPFLTLVEESCSTTTAGCAVICLVTDSDP
jgi:hypothetical protein